MIGTRLAHFELTAELGSGGMGEVYRATDTRLGRTVAIKVLPREFSRDSERLARFQREARLLASLNHPNIAGIYEVREAAGEADGGAAGPVHFLVMELVEGEELTEKISRGPLSLDEALEIALQTARGLETAHNQGVVHRDLKPANLKITPSGEVKILDFGLAKAFGVEEGAVESASVSLSPTLTRQTEAGLILGTAAYMSPEQAKGRPVDRRADIWAFGVVLYEMLTGRRTFRADTVSETLAAVLLTEVDWEKLPPGVPAPIRELLQRCLEKDPERRLQAIGEARIAIEAYRADPEAAEARTSGSAPPAPRWRGAVPWVVAAAALGVAVLLATWRTGGAPPSSPPPARFPVQISDRDLQSGYGMPVALSPDGRWLAYTVRQGAALELSLRRMEDVEPRPVSKGNEFGYHPFFSPDGEWLGFVTQRELMKVSVHGGTPIRIAPVSRSRGADWRADGTIVYAPSPAGPLYRVAASGEEEPEQLTELGEGEQTHRWPRFLPGGRAIVFTVHDRTSDFGEARIEVLDLETGQRKLIYRGGSCARYVATGHLVFARAGTLYAMPFDIDRLERLGEPVPVLDGVGFSDWQGSAHYDLTDAGLLIYGADVENADLRPQLFWGSPDRLEPVPGFGRDAFTGPTFAPDGNRLAVARGTGADSDIWILDLERAASTRLTFGSTEDFFPVWSPDGKTIAFASDRDGKVPNLYAKTADGSGSPTRLTTSRNGQFPTSWSADGKSLLFFESTPDRNFDLRVLDLESGTVEDVLATEVPERFGDFSPEGDWITYRAGLEGTEIYVQRFPKTGGRWQVSVGGGSFPRWGPAGDRIYYRDQEALMVVEVAVGEDGVRAATPEIAVGDLGPPLRLISQDYAIAPQGDRILVLESQESAEDAPAYTHMTVVVNWFEELKQRLGTR